MEPADPLTNPLIERLPVATSKEKVATRNLLLVHLALTTTQLVIAGNTIMSTKVLSKNDFNQVVFAVYRDCVALVCLFPLAHIFERKRRTPVTPRMVYYFLIAGITGVFGGQLLFLRALSLTTATAHASTVVIVPFLMFCIATICRYEIVEYWRRDGWFKILGVALGFVGAIIVTFFQGPAVFGPRQGKIDTQVMMHMRSDEQAAFGISPYRMGIILTAIGCFLYAIFGNIQVPCLRIFPFPFSFAAYAYVAGTCFLGATAALTVEVSDWRISDPHGLLLVAYQGLVQSAMVLALSAWSTSVAGPILVGAYFPLQTVITTVFSYVFLGEVIYLSQLIGGAFVIFGLYSITYGKIETNRLSSIEETSPSLA
ncbi:hypothetical protein Mapa_017252 [Marchantia paleacea]|nr:hypothetical protein Mapa_017252 [Marchantia paleacea]